MSAYVTIEPQGHFRMINGPRTGNAFGMGQLNLSRAVRSLANQAFGGAVNQITFKSQLTPSVTVDQPFAPPGAPDGAGVPQVEGGSPLSRKLLEIAKPAMYIQTPAGITIPFEPFGEPTEDYWAWALAGTAAVFGLGVWAGMKYRQRRRRRIT